MLEKPTREEVKVKEFADTLILIYQRMFCTNFMENHSFFIPKNMSNVFEYLIFIFLKCFLKE